MGTDKDGLVTIVETLHYTFAASDHGQTVRCITAGSWIDVEQDEYLASAMLNVWFSQPQDLIILYVLIVMVVIVPVTVYACKTGRRCFAGSPDCTGIGTGSRVEVVDVENPGDIIKENKGNDTHNRSTLPKPRFFDDQGTLELQSYLETMFPNAF